MTDGLGSLIERLRTAVMSFEPGSVSGDDAVPLLRMGGRVVETTEFLAHACDIRAKQRHILRTCDVFSRTSPLVSATAWPWSVASVMSRSRV